MTEAETELPVDSDELAVELTPVELVVLLVVVKVVLKRVCKLETMEASWAERLAMAAVREVKYEPVAVDATASRLDSSAAADAAATEMMLFNAAPVGRCGSGRASADTKAARPARRMTELRILNVFLQGTGVYVERKCQ